MIIIFNSTRNLTKYNKTTKSLQTMKKEKGGFKEGDTLMIFKAEKIRRT
jgi:hypothetical protein